MPETVPRSASPNPSQRFALNGSCGVSGAGLPARTVERIRSALETVEARSFCIVRPARCGSERTSTIISTEDTGPDGGAGEPGAGVGEAGAGVEVAIGAVVDTLKHW